MHSSRLRFELDQLHKSHNRTDVSAPHDEQTNPFSTHNSPFHRPLTREPPNCPNQPQNPTPPHHNPPGRYPAPHAIQTPIPPPSTYPPRPPIRRPKPPLRPNAQESRISGPRAKCGRVSHSARPAAPRTTHALLLRPQTPFSRMYYVANPDEPCERGGYPAYSPVTAPLPLTHITTITITTSCCPLQSPIPASDPIPSSEFNVYYRRQPGNPVCTMISCSPCFSPPFHSPYKSQHPVPAIHLLSASVRDQVRVLSPSLLPESQPSDYRIWGLYVGVCVEIGARFGAQTQLQRLEQGRRDLLHHIQQADASNPTNEAPGLQTAQPEQQQIQYRVERASRRNRP